MTGTDEMLKGFSLIDQIRKIILKTYSRKENKWINFSFKAHELGNKVFSKADIRRIVYDFVLYRGERTKSEVSDVCMIEDIVVGPSRKVFKF